MHEKKLVDDPEFAFVLRKPGVKKEEIKRVALKRMANIAPNKMVTNSEVYAIIRKAELMNAVGTPDSYKASVRNTLQAAADVGFPRLSTPRGGAKVKHPPSASLRLQKAKNRSVEKYLLNTIPGVFIVVPTESRMIELMKQAAVYEKVAAADEEAERQQA